MVHAFFSSYKAKVFVSAGIGAGQHNFTGPTGLAISKSGGLMYFSGPDDGTISKALTNRFNEAGLFVSSNVGESEGLAVDKNGNLYSANFGVGGVGNTIQKITPGGSVSTFVDSTLISGPIGLVFDKNGNLYCANNDGSKNTIAKITPSGSVSTFATGLNSPYGLAFDKNDNLYCANRGGNNIVKITPSGSKTDFATDITTPQYLAFDTSSKLYCGTADDKLFRISPNGNKIELTITGAALDNVMGLAFDKRGDLYAANKDDKTIVKIPTGRSLTKTLTTLQRVQKLVKNQLTIGALNKDKLDALKAQYAGSVNVTNYLNGISLQDF